MGVMIGPEIFRAYGSERVNSLSTKTDLLSGWSEPSLSSKVHTFHGVSGVTLFLFSDVNVFLPLKRDPHQPRLASQGWFEAGNVWTRIYEALPHVV